MKMIKRYCVLEENEIMSEFTITTKILNELPMVAEGNRYQDVANYMPARWQDSLISEIHSALARGCTIKWIKIGIYEHTSCHKLRVMIVFADAALDPGEDQDLELVKAGLISYTGIEAFNEWTK